MKNLRSNARTRCAAVGVAACASLLLVACGGGGGGAPAAGGGAGALSGPVVLDGSSTVEPLAATAAELYQEQQPGVQVTVSGSGTGGGFKKFCNGETDISNASRPIKDEETAACTAKNISTAQVQVANDALTVVVNKENTWATCLTVEQLTKIWAPGSTVKSWNEVDPSFPNEPLPLFGPGADSGTFDYFTDEVNGKEGESRTDYSPSEDDNVIVTGVTGAKGALGYFGFTFAEANKDTLTAVQINSGSGCVAPSSATVQDGTYTPLARPLFVYPSSEALKKPQVAGFMTFLVEQADQVATAGKAKFVPMTAEQKSTAAAALAELKQKAGV